MKDSPGYKGTLRNIKATAKELYPPISKEFVDKLECSSGARGPLHVTKGRLRDSFD
jgi:hypothetical protein